jgi:hypothetical protein
LFWCGPGVDLGWFFVVLCGSVVVLGGSGLVVGGSGVFLVFWVVLRDSGLIPGWCSCSKQSGAVLNCFGVVPLLVLAVLG